MKLIEKRLEKKKHSQIKIDRPIFIIGLPRSGTSLLYDILCAHPDSVFVNHMMNTYTETPLAAEWIRKKIRLKASGERFLKDSVEVTVSSPAEPFTYWGKWFSRDIQSLFWPEISCQDLGEDKVKEIKSDLKKIIATYNKPNGRFICKFATVQPEILLLQELFPDAKFVNIIRDGRDVAHSLLKLYHHSNNQLKRIKHPLLKHIYPYPRLKNLQRHIETFGGDSIECTSHVWNDGMEYLKQVKSNLHNYHEFKYEDLMENPGDVIQNLLNFCELDRSRDPNFEKEVNKIGNVKHVNKYAYKEIVENICASTLQENNYL
jgi:hypothetical protein